MGEEQQTVATAAPTVNPKALFSQALVAAEQDNVEAMLTVGDLYEKGLGVAKNFTKALAWYEKAANAKNAEAAFRTGLSYEIGIGTVADLAKAIAVYNRAMSLGSAKATHKIAIFHLSGQAEAHGLAKDVAKGLELLKQAAKAGEGAAYNTIAMIFLHGQFGQKVDQEKAIKTFTFSAQIGNLEGMKNLALLLAEDNQPQDALRWAIIAQSGGLQTPELINLIASTRSRADGEAEIQKAAEEARQWIESYQQRRAQAAPGGPPDAESAQDA
jgi:TPR repeat protein